MEQSRDLTNRNRIGSHRPDERSTNREVHIHQGPNCRSGGCAVKAVKLTSGDLRRVPEPGLREPQGNPIAAQKSADGIVGVETSRVEEDPEASPAEGLNGWERQVGLATHGW